MSQRSKRINPRLLVHLRYLVANGMNTVQSMRHELEKFVREEFSSLPSRGDASYYPTDETIHTHIVETLRKRERIQVMFSTMRYMPFLWCIHYTTVCPHIDIAQFLNCTLKLIHTILHFFSRILISLLISLFRRMILQSFLSSLEPERFI